MSLESACSYLLPRLSLYSVSFLPGQPVSRISLLVPPASHVSLFNLFPAWTACLSNQPAVPPAPSVSLSSLFPASAAGLSNQPARPSCLVCLLCLPPVSKKVCVDILSCPLSLPPVSSLYQLSPFSTTCPLSLPLVSSLYHLSPLSTTCPLSQPPVSSLYHLSPLSTIYLLSLPSVSSLYHLSPQQASTFYLVESSVFHKPFSSQHVPLVSGCPLSTTSLLKIPVNSIFSTACLCGYVCSLSPLSLSTTCPLTVCPLSISPVSKSPSVSSLYRLSLITFCLLSLPPVSKSLSISSHHRIFLNHQLFPVTTACL
jgi:hypothetical protein